MGSVFRFKQFEVDQQGCAMKINTDGVLLGAIAAQVAPAHILDIGTGTGVIALMLAQRFGGAQVEAVEIDVSAAERAAINFKGSPFSARLVVYSSSIEDFQTAKQYDLIVSNPPYFVNDLKNTDKRKEIARHADENFFDALLRKTASLLTPSGALWLILPVKQAEKVVVNAVLQKLFPSRIIAVHSDISKEAFRHIICLGTERINPVIENVFIYATQGKYTDQYQLLLKDFLLAF